MKLHITTVLIGQLYDALVEPLLHRWKKRTANYIKNFLHGRTLDVCCGTGKQCQLVAENGDVIGLDLSLSMLKFARQQAPGIPFVCADAGRLPFKKETFHNAIISLALHDKSPDLRKKMVFESKRALSASGNLLVIDFEKPATFKAHLAYLIINIFELAAGREHFCNGRQFITAGGLTSFLKEYKWSTIKIHSGFGSALSLIKASMNS